MATQTPASTEPLVATGATDTTQDPSSHGATDPDMALCSGLSLDNTMAPIGSMALGYPHGHRLKPRSQAFMWLLVAIQATVPGCGRTMATARMLPWPQMAAQATLINVAFQHQYGLRWPQIPSMAMVFDCLRSHSHQHRPWLQQGHGHKHGSG